jgi:hypothetical protein
MDNASAMTVVPLDNLRVISLKQPWAFALVKGDKDVENRPFHLKLKNKPIWGLILASKNKPTKKELVRYEQLSGKKAPERFESQTIIGAVEFIASVEESESKWYDGGIAWVVGKRVILPTPIKNIPGFLNPLVYLDRHPQRERILRELGI